MINLQVEQLLTMLPRCESIVELQLDEQQLVRTLKQTNQTVIDLDKTFSKSEIKKLVMLSSSYTVESL